MGSERLHSLQATLQDWEAQYQDVRQELQLHELYLLWLRLFRLSRQMSMRLRRTLIHENGRISR
jgi:hypothetical protein